ncbi:Haspin Ser [Trichuris trichiura]|uniref:Haspin Ser n=1 Tax=Trichuris trichiura TaxID=36087 RepID=A0A077ZJT4_TRITR|nr:Haspin Ser [Trichuris trichiura]
MTEGSSVEKGSLRQALGKSMHWNKVLTGLPSRIIRLNYQGKYPRESLQAYDNVSRNNHIEKERSNKVAANHRYLRTCIENGGVTFEKVRGTEAARKFIKTTDRDDIRYRVQCTSLPSDSEIIEGSEDHAHMLPLMRDLLRNSWAGYNPKTNVLWIAYLIDVFANGTDYLGAPLASAKKARSLNIKGQVEECSWSEEMLLFTDLFALNAQFVRQIRTSANLPSTR